MNSLYTFAVFSLLVVFSIGTASADALCPDPEEALQSNVADLASVQADVERYELCVERARLLNQLDQLIVARDGILSARKTKVKQDSFGSEFLPQIQSLKSISADTIKKITPEEMGLEQKKEEAPKAMPEPTGYRNWYVTKIWGQSGLLSAQLRSKTGRVLTVQDGSNLPSGENVIKVSGDGVLVELNDGSQKELIWDDGTL